MTTNHTPTPLEAKRLDAAHAVIYGADGMMLAKMAGHETAFERAEEIVTACNAHDDLVAALRRVLEDYSEHARGCPCQICAARATLAKVQS